MVSMRQARFGCHRIRILLLAFLLAAPASLKAGDIEGEGFASDRAAAVHFLRPLFPIMDCEGMGVVGKGEVDDHFFALFYSVGERGAFSISRNDLARAYADSNERQISHIFSMMDQGGNDAVSTNEFRSFLFEALALADIGQKGEVTLADLGLDPPRIIRAQDR